MNQPAATDIPWREGVYCRVGDLAHYASLRRVGAEMLCVKNAVALRQEEFCAGRALVRELLAEIGRPVSQVLSQDRLPVWPAGVRGSISHTRDLVGAVVTEADHSPGLDIEQLGAVSAEVAAEVLLAEEAAYLERNGLDPTIIFAAKEALFKAAYPLVSTYFEFKDVTLTFTGNAFRASSRLPFAGAFTAGRGSYSLLRGHVVAKFLID